MRKVLFGGLLMAAVALGGASCDKLTPAETALMGCETYTSALKQTLKPREQGKFNQSVLKIIDSARDMADPFCLGPAPDVNSDVKDIAVDAATRSLQGVLKLIN